MYDELVKSLRQCAEASCAGCKNDLVQIGCRGLLQHEAADAIDKLVKICNSILSKYEEASESVIYEYSGHIDKDIDELHKEIEDYKAQINGGTEPPKEGE